MKYILLIFISTMVYSCPDDDELCLSCSANTCLMCSNSYLDTATGKCKKPNDSIANCV